MPFSSLLLNSTNNKRKCLLSDNNENNDYFQDGNQKKLKFENNNHNNEENFDLQYLFKISNIPVVANIEDKKNMEDNSDDKTTMTYENDYQMMDDDEVQVEQTIMNTKNTSKVEQIKNIQTPEVIHDHHHHQEQKQQYSFWKYHLHDSYFHCRSHFY